MMRWFSVVMLGATVLIVPAAWADEAPVTPAAIYQAGDALYNQLAAYHTANASQPAEDPDAPALTERLPRHVFQKAREVLLKVEALRKLKGLPENPVPQVAVREIVPADTMKLLTQALADTKELASAFGNPPMPPAPPLVEGKTPTDAYDKLSKVSLSLDGLGLPASVPNDVYRITLTMVSDIELIRAARKISTPVAEPGEISPKKPADVYDIAYTLLSDLKTLVESNPDYAIPKGIILPNKRAGTIKPSYALEMMNLVQAETTAIKAKVGATKPTELAPPQSGKSPTDTYRQETLARALIATLK